MSTSENVKAARVAAGLTQAAAAQRLGVTTHCVYHWESGLRSPSYLSALRLQQVFGVPFTEFLAPLSSVAS
jgi:transcriptional regulator with XRE-family HTH domain